MVTKANALYRKLPSIDEIVRDSRCAPISREYGSQAVGSAARDVLTQLRSEIGAGRLDEGETQSAVDGIFTSIEERLRNDFAPSLERVVNATGVVLHTNLGRAPLSTAAIRNVADAASRYCNLEFDIDSGERGQRDVHVQRLFARMLNAEDAPEPIETVIVNNCAAAVMLALNTLAEGGEVIVSRGELVEIGGSFRVPDVMAKSQAILREVGTTNRTRISDYEGAINEKTRLLLRVHRSNFAIVGFTEQPSLEELVALGKKHQLPVIEDQGNGALFDLRQAGVRGESGVTESLRAGVDVVTYSGDKLLGGPQAGMLSGRPATIARIRRNPLFRALRADKLAYAALEATLLDYLRGHHERIPALRMMLVSADELRERAEKLTAEIRHPQLELLVRKSESLIGGGTAPTATLPTFVVAVRHRELGAETVATRLRHYRPPIIARVEEDTLLIDLRTVFPEEEAILVSALKAL